MPKVWNKRDPKTPKDAVYVGRPTKWGNPFVIGKDGDREEVIRKYRAYVDNLRYTSDLFIHDLNELRGKDLVCWCAPFGGIEFNRIPTICHAQILGNLANG